MSKLTNDEAIHVLVLMKMAGGSAFENTITNDALDIAIRAIKEYRTKTNPDLISRHEALMELNGACSNWQDDATVADIIKGLPSCHNCMECDSELAPVVRCKDCEYMTPDETNKYQTWCTLDNSPWFENDYCSRAKLKGGVE